jgi:hypothetical protein
MIVLGIVLVLVTVWANVLAVTAGVYEVEDGIVAMSLFLGSTHYDWTQLASFEHRRRGTHDFVYARLTDGNRRRLLNVLQGQRVVWDGGETRNIVGVLNERLAKASKPKHRGDQDGLSLGRATRHTQAQ